MMQKILAVFVAACMATRVAAVTFGAPFGDHMVLQRDQPIRVWGAAGPNEQVKVSFGGSTITVRADTNGKWAALLPACAANSVGRELSANDARLKDVLVGEVWLASGQSNMACPTWSDSPRFHDESGRLLAYMTSLPLLRYAKVSASPAEKPQASFGGAMRWLSAVPGDLATVPFSAVAFYFARELQLALGVPVGIVDASLGGTNIDAWIPNEGFAGEPILSDLAGWKFLPSSAWRDPKVRKFPIDAYHQQPTVLWNGYLAPLAPLTVRGLIWYQGERNCVAGEAGERYEAKLRALQDGWSRCFGNPDLKMYVVQLCSWGPDITAFQETQRRFCASRANAHLAVINDLADPKDIHPPRKEPVGRRLAALALKYEYGFKDIPAEAPFLQSAVAVNGMVVLNFSDVQSLYLRNAERTDRSCIELAGEDGVFHPARIVNLRARKPSDVDFGAIDGSNLVVAADGVISPSKVRYLAASPRIGVLFNQVGLPVAGFDTSVTAQTVWRPKERWRGFNLEGYGLKGTFAGRIEESDFEMIHELGFNFVRLMVDYRYLSLDHDWTKPDPMKFGFLDKVIAMGRERGIHINLCLSIPPGVDYKVTRSKEVLFADPKAQQALADYWRFMAGRYRGISNDGISFNLFNEPNSDPKGDRYERLIEKCLGAIAAEDPKRFVVVDGLDYGRRPELGAVRFRNVAQSLHAYDPMCVSHYMAPWLSGRTDEPHWPFLPVYAPIFGDRKPQASRGPIVIRSVSDSLLTLRKMTVNRQGELYVRADGREIFRELFRPKPAADWTNVVARTNGEWAGNLVREFNIRVPRCDRLEIGVLRGDWIGFDGIELAAEGARAEISTMTDFTRAQEPRREVWFAGFGENAFAVDDKGTAYSGHDYLADRTFRHWDKIIESGQMVTVGEFGFFNRTPHQIGLAWMEDNLREWKNRGIGWALWNFRGAFGILDSGRSDAEYVDFHGHKLDVKMLELLNRY